MAMKIKEIKFEEFAEGKLLASKTFRNLEPAITRESERYCICILTGRRFSKGLMVTSYWDYFYTDKTGLITDSPPGYGREYNRKVRITNMEQAHEEYKDKRLNEDTFVSKAR